MAAVKFRPKLRLVVLMLLVWLGSAAVAGRLVWMQGLASDRYTQLAAEQRVRRFVLPPQRGSIYDRDRVELAISMDMQTIFANPRFVPDPQAAAEALGPVLGLEVSMLEEKLSRESGFVYLARKADPALAETVKGLRLPGIDTVAESKRFYPASKLASHVVGFVGVDNEGLGGLEQRHDRLLTGTPGEVLMERDPRGRPIPAGRSRFIPPTAGHDLILALDRQIQFTAESALVRAVEQFGAKGGTIIVMKPGSGEVLALANLPTFDPNEPGNAPADTRRNRAVTDVYEPGSTSKVVTAAAALESHVIKAADVLHVPDRIALAGKVFNDWAPHPPLDITFAQVIQQSSNVGTIKVAAKLGKERLHEYMKKFGYGLSTGVEFPGESRGMLPDPDAWWETSLPTMAIGQGVAVTPLQIVNVYATLANGGVAVAPRFVLATVDERGTLKPSRPGGSRRVIAEETASVLTEILVGATELRHGTGRNAAIDGYQVAGKTGSSQKVIEGQPGYSGYISSFIGFAPAGDPRLVVGVILDDPRPIWGSVTAAPAFKEVMQFALRHLGIGPGPVLHVEGAPLPAPVRSGGATGEEPASPIATD